MINRAFKLKDFDGPLDLLLALIGKAPRSLPESIRQFTVKQLAQAQPFQDGKQPVVHI